MTRPLAILAAAIGLTALVPSTASAWYCRANASDGHYGWASYVDRRQAAREALRECAARARQPMSCRIQNCIPD